jgi:hypothetical protein
MMSAAMHKYTRYTFAERPDRADEADEKQTAVWDIFMLQDPIAHQYWGYLMNELAAFQFMICDQSDTIVAVGFTVPLAWDQPLDALPESGWDWVLEKGIQDLLTGRTPNMISAISAGVTIGYQGQGLSTRIVQGMRSLVIEHGFQGLIAPVRPNQKSRYPLIPMERYVHWTRPDGLPFDPWMRVHKRLGAEIVKVAPRSMAITGTLSEWEEWAQMPFPESGTYTVPGALAPIEIDVEKNLGTYLEPNVWMYHASDRRT